jgi:DNA recombination protein RmuC
LLFLPLESAFQLVFQMKPEIMHWAWEKRVAIVGPSTLMTSLLTVSNLWKLDRQNKNAHDIAKRAGALYDKFYGFVQDMNGVGEKLSSAQKSWELAQNKLNLGPGNILGQIEKLKELGAKTEKKLSVTEPDVHESN